MAANSNQAVAAVKPFKRSVLWNRMIWVGLFIGVITFLMGLQTNSDRIWQAFLLNSFFFISLAVGGLFFVSIQYVTKAGWSVVVRRIAESLTSYLVVGSVAILAVTFYGAKSLFPWMDSGFVAANELVYKKAAYLNSGFFSIRTLIFAAIWFLFARLIVGSSVKQDQTGDVNLTHRNLKFSIGFLILFALTYSLFSVDYLMSLDPLWYSTIFGVYTFSGLFQSTLSFIILITLSLRKRGLLDGYVTDEHMHDLAKFLFAFTVFYAYIAFSQFMLIWYANIPEETAFFLHRSHGGWMGVSLSLPILKFAVPFFALLPRAAKRDMSHLVRVCVLMVIMQMVDLYWLIYPNFHESPVLPLWEIGLFAGFLGLFLLMVGRFLESHAIVPIGDPRLHESLHHHT
ncbi:MAG: molybdopterin oxidoreductase [Bdellovibrionales bacterium CG10_big_fil_rev_8_21_14_0_10_45_34]|nr:MAG: molybdopterin oxidoreductase [Bdellovibrionales bacterium CG10_big_fil_rev_8_21_14_0_10_45_34]